MEKLYESLQLMGIGLTTVFSVLLLVIYLGKGLIALVNRFAPEEEKPKAVANNASASNVVDPNVAQAINMAISQLTAGKSQATKIERI